MLIRRSGGERTLGCKSRGSNGPKVVKRRLDHCSSSLLFLFQLHGAHAADCLFSLDTLLFTGLQYFFVFDTEFATLHIEAIQGGDDGIGVGSLAEVGKGQAAERALLIEMVVEGIRSRNGQGCLEMTGLIGPSSTNSEGHTMISRRVSRLTLKGMFLMTIAVGIISSSGF